MELAWSNEVDSYQLHFLEPKKTNSPLRSYQIYVRYSNDGDYSDETVTVSAQHYETTLPLGDVCDSMLDDVHVTILAYGSDMKNGLIPGHPVHRYFRCGDLIIVGLSSAIMCLIAILVVSVFVMLVMSWIHRNRLKTSFMNAVWPTIEKPDIFFPPSSRDDEWGDENMTEKSQLLQEYEECDDFPEIIQNKIQTVEEGKLNLANSASGGFDSGISDYSAGSSKSVPIYRLTGYRMEFRRPSHASSGISSQHSSQGSNSGSNSGKSGIQSIHTLSSNHSGDSVLAKTVSDQPWPKNFTITPTKINFENYIRDRPTQIAQYSVMGDSFDFGTLKTRPAIIPETNGYIGHGYVENSIFNMTNMPTVFLENFKKIQQMKSTPILDPNEYVSQDEYGGYKPISALFPSPQEPEVAKLPPGYTAANIFDIPLPSRAPQIVPDLESNTGYVSDQTSFDDYVTDTFLPTAFNPINKTLLQPEIPQVQFF